jgi:hypothetical protein
MATPGSLKCNPATVALPQRPCGTPANLIEGGARRRACLQNLSTNSQHSNCGTAVAQLVSPLQQNKSRMAEAPTAPSGEGLG